MALIDRLDPCDALAHELTTQDRREAGQARHNPYALGIMLGAVEEIRAEVARGVPFVDAFADHFNATRSLHSVARRLRLPLDVQRGEWVKASAGKGGA